MRKIVFPLLWGLLCMTSCSEEAPLLGEVVFDKVTADTILCHCHVEITAGAVADCGIYYGTTKSQVLNGTSDEIKGKYDGTAIRGEITGLTPNKTYYIKMYGMNEAGRCETGMAEVKTSARTPSMDDNKYPDTQP